MQSSPTEPDSGAAIGPGEPGTAEEAVLTAMISLGRRMRQRLADDQVDFSSLTLLKTLMYGGPMRLSALAASLELDASTVSRHASHLEQRGLLERAEDPDDRRAAQVMLSEHGRTCLENGARTRRTMIASVLEHWSERDREQLRVLLTRFHADLTATFPADHNLQENP